MNRFICNYISTYRINIKICMRMNPLTVMLLAVCIPIEHFDTLNHMILKICKKKKFTFYHEDISYIDRYTYVYAIS